MSYKPNYYKNRVCINVLAGSVENAKECYDATEGHAVIGVLSKSYESDELAIEDMARYQAVINNALSIGLGGGDPKQTYMVTRLAKALKAQHINQVFTGVGSSRVALENDVSVVNGLVSPSGKVGYVNIATGPLSSQSEAAIVSIDTAIMMLKDMGGSSVKYYPMNGLTTLDEYKAVCEACAKHDFGLEPTGGLDLDNYETILQTAVDAGVQMIIPHIYTSVIDKDTGLTRPEDVKTLYAITQKVLGE